VPLRRLPAPKWLGGAPSVGAGHYLHQAHAVPYRPVERKSAVMGRKMRGEEALSHETTPIFNQIKGGRLNQFLYKPHSGGIFWPLRAERPFFC
jgi:hypothetical protein